MIALQETEVPAKLPGYRAFHCQVTETDAPAWRGVTTLVRRNIPACQENLIALGPEYVFVKILPAPKKKKQQCLHILNIYSSVKQSQNLTLLLQKAWSYAQGQPLLIVGDFNAPHPEWGYPHVSRKGRGVLSTILSHQMRLLTDPAHPTRQGNSVQRDTTPDLTITHNIANSVWRNTGHDLGSDHYVVETLIQGGPTLASTRSHKLVDWDVFRSLCDANLPRTL